MATRVVEWKKPYTWWQAIDIDENKVISLRLRDENNLIIYDEWDDEIYVDLQLDDEITPTSAFPVWVNTGRVIVDNWWDKTWTIIVAKTTSGDNIKLLYADDWTLWMDNWTGTFKQIYFKADVDALLLALRQYIDEQLALKQDVLTAGDNITISTETESDMRWPCPMWFHIPTQSEIDIIYWINPVNLKIPFTWYRDDYGYLTYNGIVGATWTCTPSGDNASYEYLIGSGVTRRNSMPRTCAYCIRPFKDTPVIPDSSWTSITSDIKRNPSLWLISLTNDGGNTWITLSDKNAWATIVYDTTDPMTDANCWYMYQWGNNHPFSCFGSISTTSWTVDASGYWPWNYYDNSAYIRGNSWDSSNNGNLRWWISQWIHLWETRISATDTTYTAGSWISIDQNNEISNTAQPTVVSDDSWVTYHITVSNSDPASWTASNIITLVP